MEGGTSLQFCNIYVVKNFTRQSIACDRFYRIQLIAGR